MDRRRGGMQTGSRKTGESAAAAAAVVGSRLWRREPEVVVPRLAHCSGGVTNWRSTEGRKPCYLLIATTLRAVLHR